MAFLAAWMILVAHVLMRFSDGVMPTDFLIRPLLVVTLVALAIGGLAMMAGRRAVPAAGVLAVLAIGSLVLQLAVAALVIALILAGRRGWQAPGIVVPLATAVLGVAMFRAVPLLEVGPGGVLAGAPEPVYLVLLDGYPRPDTLSELGIDVAPFLEQLRDRGFDHYPDAHSLHAWTHNTLTALLGGSVIEGRGSDDDRRMQRASWELPADFRVIRPPVGHVTIPRAVALDSGGMNELEADLLGRSIVRFVASGVVMDGLRARVEEGLDTLALAEGPVFAHLAFPHPPFLYNSDGADVDAPACWPECGIFGNSIQTLGITRAEWADGMAGNVAHLNTRLIEVIDAILVRHPDATIVLFSDHGGRIDTADLEEWHLSFLAARTPTPNLYHAEPRPDAVLRLLGY